MRLIDAEVFEDLFHKQMELGASGFEAAEDALHDTPTVDAVQVVRCKDCANIDPAVRLPDGMFYCNEWSSTTRGHWYCCRGEKEEED